MEYLTAFFLAHQRIAACVSDGKLQETDAPDDVSQMFTGTCQDLAFCITALILPFTESRPFL